MGVPRVIFGYDKLVADFVCSQVNELDNQLKGGWYAGLGVVVDNRLIAGVVFNEYRKTDIRESFAAIEPRWATHATLRTLFSYPFVHLGVRRMTGIVEKKNKKSRELTLRLGFKYEGNCRKAMDNGDDAIIYGMLKEECKWIL